MKPAQNIQVTGPLLVFGGPYSNLAATRAMKTIAETLNVPPSQVICTGDVIAYCAEPEETAQLVRAWGCHVVAGNCEEQVAAGAADCGCGFAEGTACDLLSKGWYPFALARISAQSREWMRCLPAAITFTLSGRSFRVVHGGVHETSKFLFASQKAALCAETDQAGCDIIIGGHAGIPFIERLSQKKAWFNPGVIGMPANDGTPDGWYGLVLERGDDLVLETRRLRYDFHNAAAAMRRSGHANAYARALITGEWPSLDVLPEKEKAAKGRRLREKRLVVKGSRLRGALSQQSARPA